jgi:H+-translocating NAD(P) transhydrogenase subunit alpha
VAPIKIGVLTETRELETRVALIPAVVPEIIKLGAEVLVQQGAGDKSRYLDPQFEKTGARIVPGPEALYGEADVVVKVRPPREDEVDMLREGSTLVGILAPLTERKLVQRYRQKKITAFSMELVPRIARAQSMDVLSSMATVAGYKAVLLGAEHLGKFFPLLMTAAGTIPPASVLIVGAGVAGLQAIATARRLGARVEAFDTRPAVREQVESLGARFVEMELPEDAETEGGYAKEMTEAFIQKEMEAIGSRLPKTDLVITTAQVFGKKAPLLVTAEMVEKLAPGSVIVDMAAEQGGNCELTRAGEVVQKYGVTILGPRNLPGMLPVHASQMYARNVTNFLKHVYHDGDLNLEWEDEIVSGTCITHEGELVNELVKKALAGEGSGS